jgi:hypothetical protein
MHDIRRADSRAVWTAGRSSPMRIAMIAITTSSSTSVNAALRHELVEPSAAFDVGTGEE